MSYADATYYTSTFLGTDIPSAEQAKWLARASDSIDQLTAFRISLAGGLSSLTTFQQGQVKKATCYQAEHLYMYGDMPSPDMEEYQVGNNRVKFGSNVDMRYSRAAYDLLVSANLMYRGLGSCVSLT